MQHRKKYLNIFVFFKLGSILSYGSLYYLNEIITDCGLPLHFCRPSYSRSRLRNLLRSYFIFSNDHLHTCNFLQTVSQSLTTKLLLISKVSSIRFLSSFFVVHSILDIDQQIRLFHLMQCSLKVAWSPSAFIVDLRIIALSAYSLLCSLQYHDISQNLQLTKFEIFYERQCFASYCQCRSCVAEGPEAK